ncbi:MAG: HAMP domain-containing sensor histidine kinase [Chloroflexota bacterium]
MRFFDGVRGRLLLSYVALLIVTLIVSAVTLLLILSTRPAPTDQTYRDLINIVGGLNVRALRGNTLPLRNNPDLVVETIFSYADETDMRVLIIDDETLTVVRDSDEVLAAGAPFVVYRESIERNRFERENARLNLGIEYVVGAYRDDGHDWLFLGLAPDGRPFGSNLAGDGSPGDETNTAREGGIGGRGLRNQGILTQDSSEVVIFSLPRASISMADAVQQFGTSLTVVMVQSTLVGVVVASLMAVVVSRTIARPLQSLAKATQAVGEGDYSTRVDARGPYELREVAGAFNVMSEQVQLTNEAQRDLLANVSHDLKTPLTSIQGFSQAIMDGTAPDSSKAASIIYEESGRLARLVTQLTELARIKAGRLSMRMEPLDMTAFVGGMTDRIEVVAEKKNLTITRDLRAVPPVIGDGDKIAQVINNLLSNAVKYTPNGGKVHVVVGPVAEGVRVDVRDTGIGIPQEDLSRVFERFYQVDKSRGPARGHGLGLAITHEIVTAHGGRINVASEGQGKGSTFSVWLPQGAH